MCGLKHVVALYRVIVMEVTPYVGVWIETVCIAIATCLDEVTPYVGVWIETKHHRP